MKISNRTSVQEVEKIKLRPNPYRKNWLKNIKKENQELGDKLTNLKSTLEYKNFSKSIESYERVKKSMMANRRAKLPQLPQVNRSVSLVDSRRVFKTLPT